MASNGKTSGLNCISYHLHVLPFQEQRVPLRNLFLAGQVCNSGSLVSRHGLFYLRASQLLFAFRRTQSGGKKIQIP